MVLEPLTRQKRALGYLALAGLGAAMIAALRAGGVPGLAFQEMVVVDRFATFFRVLVIGVGILTVLMSFQFLRREGAESGEYYALVLYSVAGQCVMASANDLILIFIGLEISSIATYVLAGYLRGDQRANEAAIKYFLLGSFATAFFLYGVAWVYGFTGSTNLVDIRRFLAIPGIEPPAILVSGAAALIFVGLAFKVSAAPFQIWAPDVYQGAPTPVAAFLSAGPKAAAFAILVRIFMTAFQSLASHWEPVIWASALATMIVGNFAALRQSNIKRMLAYSSIAHAGYILVAVAAHSDIGISAVMFYLAAYAFMNMGAFTVVAHFSRKGEQYLNIEDFAGLSTRQPATAAVFSIFLFSLIGVPLTGGFFGKFYIFRAALEANLIWLTVLGLLTSTVAAYYYLRVIVVMYMHEPGAATDGVPAMTAGYRTVLWTCALGTFVLGIFPSALLRFIVN
jgi:NADH-quinone oxidoreductase subunit N